MKKNLINVVCIFLFLTNAFGQEKITKITRIQHNGNTGLPEIKGEVFYEYDNLERQIGEKDLTYYDNDTIINYYTTNGYFKDSTVYHWYSYNTTVDSIRLTSFTTNFLNSDNCAIKSDGAHFHYNEQYGLEETISYSIIERKYEPNSCFLLEEISYLKSYPNETEYQNWRKKVYEYTKNYKNIRETSFKWNEILNDWEYFSESEEIFDDDGRVLSHQNSSVNGTELNITYIYDEFGHEIYQELKQTSSNFLQNHWTATETIIEYDENNFVIKTLEKIKNLLYEGVVVETEIFYENYCDGTVKVSKVLNPSTQIFTESHYEYLHGTDCEPPKENQTLTVFPNPTNGQITLQSELLSNATTNIEIVDITGRILEKIAVSERIASYQMNVGHLPFGNYFVRVISDNQSVVAPLVINQF